MKDANERTDDDIEAILEFLLHFPVSFPFSLLRGIDESHSLLLIIEGIC